MLNRKQSVRVIELAAPLEQPLGAGELLADYGLAPAAAAAPISGAATAQFASRPATAWFSKGSVRHFMRLCSVASLLSVCANTSNTFSHHPRLLLVTFLVDLVSGVVFALEMALKIHARKLFAGPNAYARNRWCQFDASMVLFIWVSILLQIFEMFEIVKPYSVLSVLRSPRPLILVRFIRVFFKFSMPKTRIKQIFKRSSQQIYNVTLFFLFFMILYGLLGVQLFGQIEKHCVVNGTSLHEITINSLAIPDTHCSGSPNYGNQCPLGMVCLDLHLPKEIVGYNGFDHIGHSLYTVYQTSSQEGWSHLMYSTFDHYPAWKVAGYFVSLIFFLGWMVRNVFIAVFTETFNEIRVQFQQMWGERHQALASEGVPMVLRGDDSGWRLEEAADQQATSRWVPQMARRFQNSATFQVLVLCAILANVCLSASVHFKHNGKKREHFYMHIYEWEIGFTVFFNLEALFKIACLGFGRYWKRTSHRFELFLAIGCTLHVLSPKLFMTELLDFQVLRVIRLIKASPVLEDFAHKSFGPGRKLGSLIMFTVCLMVVTSAMTMQLFCSLYEYHRFENFPNAFISMFQILTQEAWTDVMNETMLRVRDHIGPYVAVYFIMYHLFVSLIVLSLFVAVILDNLELPEDLKKAKQEKAREQIACISEELPKRLRVFELFPNSPQMTKLNKLASAGGEFNVPKVRESFMRHFVDQIDPSSRMAIKRQCLVAAGGSSIGGAFGPGALGGPLHATGSLSTGRLRSHLLQSQQQQHQTIASSVRRSLKSKLRAAALAAAASSQGGGFSGGQPAGQGGSFASAARLQLTRKSPAASASARERWTRPALAMLSGSRTLCRQPEATTPLDKEAPERHAQQQQKQQQQLPRPQQAVAPVPELHQIKLLSAQAPRCRKAARSELLRKTTISQLIEESNLQRISLMSDELNLDSFALRAAAAVGGYETRTSLAGAEAGGLERLRLNSFGAINQKWLCTTSYDYLRGIGESGGGSGGIGGGGIGGSCNIGSANNGGLGPSVGLGGQENLRQAQDLNIKMLKRKRQQAELKRCQRERDLRENHPLFDTPLFIVGRESRLRKFCQLLAWAKYKYNDRNPITGKLRKSQYKSLHNLLGLVSYFDWLMIVVTTISCVSMMFETPTMRLMNTPALQVAEYTFVAAMSLELTLKTLANGLVFTPKALLSTVAGLLDMFIFISSLVYVVWMPQEVESQSLAQYLMLLRCVRPLRVFSLIPHMRQVVYELVRGFKAIFLVCILLGLLCFVFACYGVHIFGGRLARCTDPTVATRENCTGTFLRKVYVTKMRVPTDDQTYPALLVPRVWANPHRFSFDDIKSAMLALFEVLSFKGWVDIREALLKRFDNSPHWLYIHIFVFFGCMVGVTLFVGVVIANYGENKGTALLTVDQRRWCDLKKRLKIAQPLHLPPRPDHVILRAFIYDIIQNILFKRIIAFLVLCNSSLLIVHWNPDERHTLSFATVSACLTVAFTVEVIMKMIAFSPRGYWQSRRNRYDLAVTLIGLAWALVHFLLTTSNWSNSFGFIVVILRFFTITGKHATLQMLMLTVVVSVYKSFFIILGLFVLVLFYSLLGVQLFGSVKYGENLSRQANFKTAKLGTITMFRIVTGEDWYRMMHDCMIVPPYCTRGKNYWQTDCGHFGLSFAFFSSFYIIITHIVLNLLVAIIMENFSLFYSSEEDALLSYTDIRNFQNTWNIVDSQQRGSIPVRRVKFILRLLKGRLEVDPTRDQHLIKHMCHEMERLHNGDDVSFHDVLSMLSYRSVDINKSLQFEELLARKELENIIEEEVAKKTIRSWLDQCLRRVRQQRQQNSLIQGLRLTNMGGTELYSPSPLVPVTSSSLASGPAATKSTGAAQQPPAGLLSSSSERSPQTPRLLTAAGGLLFGAASSSTGDQTGPALRTGSSTSDSQHSITSAATIATIAASIGKLKRRVEASRSESSAAAICGGSIGGAQRRLLSSQAVDHKKEERSQQLRRAIKALTNPAAALNFNLAAGSQEVFLQRVGALDELGTGGLGSAATSAKRDEEEEAEALMKQQYRPKLNSAISDIHKWWEYQMN